MCKGFELGGEDGNDSVGMIGLDFCTFAKEVVNCCLSEAEEESVSRLR